MQDTFRSCLVDMDVAIARRAWAVAFPHLPRLGDDHDVLVVLHYARTQANSIALRLRAYSHRWLLERDYPSGLPDHLRQSAERLYPVVVGVVGVSTRTRTPLAMAVRDAMNNAVMECYADGHQEPEIVRPRMLEKRQHVLRM